MRFVFGQPAPTPRGSNRPTGGGVLTRTYVLAPLVRDHYRHRRTHQYANETSAYATSDRVVHSRNFVVMGPRCRRQQHVRTQRSIPIDAEATDHDDDEENERIPFLTSGYARMRCASCLPSGGPERQLDPFTHELPLLTAIKEHIVRRGPHNCVSSTVRNIAARAAHPPHHHVP